MLRKHAAADAVHTLSNAPKPTKELANSVADSISLLTQMMQQASKL